MQLTYQDLKNLTDSMTEEQLSQPVYLFADFDSTWLNVSGTDTLQQGDVQQIEREGLGTTITGLPYLLVTDEIED
jgi:hypothetical protein